MIGIYCPDIPPVPGGVSDHTLALARALAKLGAPPAVLARHGDPQLFTPLACRVGIAPGQVAGAARELGVTALVLQYVPFLFAQRGVAPALVGGVRRLAAARIRLAVMLHEPFVPFTRLPWLITGALQRLQLRLLLGPAERVYTPVPAWADIARRYAGAATQVAVAPVGATVPVSQLSRAQARKQLGLEDGPVAIGIFSPAASGFAHSWIAAAAARLAGRRDVAWVRFGFGSDRPLPGYPAGDNVITLGTTSAGRVADTMRALDIAAAPYIDGLTLRRSGAMLALAHGVATVSSEGHLFDPGLRALAACEPSERGFAERIASLTADPAQRAELAARSSGYGAIASVECLAARLVRDLEAGA